MDPQTLALFGLGVAALVVLMLVRQVRNGGRRKGDRRNDVFARRQRDSGHPRPQDAERFN
jgi:hypothetical protein